MTLQDLTARYVGIKQAAGADFTSSAQLLSMFCRVVDGTADIGAILPRAGGKNGV